jgi:putative transposase
VSKVSGVSISRQCELLGLSRGSYYYGPVTESPENLHYMRLMDEEYLKHPFYGVWQMTYFLRNLGHGVNPKRVRRLLRLMGLEAVCPGPHTSKPGKGPGHQVFPYLLKGLEINRPGQVIGTDITYIPMGNGFLYLVAFIDWYSRYVLSWELSNNLGTGFCIEALDRIWDMVEVGILNTDQGSQFTSDSFTGAVKTGGARHSMDGKGRAIDNIFTERLWRSVKYEEVYLKSYSGGLEAWESLNLYFDFYNNERPNKHLGGIPPVKVFSGQFQAPPVSRC